ncbi:MAG: hypothetical protein WD034_08855 [Parvibaculum sp.]
MAKHMETEHDDAHPAAPHPVSRRDIVVLGGTALIAAALPALLFRRAPKSLSFDADVLLKLLADPEAAAKLGEIWFAESRPGETRAVYETRLARRLRAFGWSPAATPELAHRALAATTRADYRTGRMVEIEKWQFAETEADLCALAALVRREHAPEA